MKNIILLLTLIACSLTSGCATATFAQSTTKYKHRLIEPVALFKNANGDIAISGHVVDDKPESTKYFVFPNSLNTEFNKATPVISDSGQLARFLDKNVPLFCLQKPLENRPLGYDKAMDIDPSKFKNGTFDGWENIEEGKLRKLNMIWTIPVDILTSPILLIALMNLPEC